MTSPPVVKSLTLEEFLSLPEKKRKQFEGGFLACVEEPDSKRWWQRKEQGAAKKKVRPVM